MQQKSALRNLSVFTQASAVNTALRNGKTEGLTAPYRATETPDVIVLDDKLCLRNERTRVLTAL